MNGNIPDTFWTTQEELLLFGGACLLGIPSGVLFDCFRLLRKLLPHRNGLLVAAEDFVWITTICVVLLVYANAFAKGVFRGYYAAGCLIGFLLYECTLGRAAVFVLEKLLRLLWTPVRFVGCGIALICKKVLCRFVETTKKFGNRHKNTQNPLQKSAGMVYNNDIARKKGKHHDKLLKK